MEEGVPIYLQILRHIKRGVIAGQITDGDELPSRRVLSALLGVNPNTVQKALAELEDMGLIRTERTNGKFVTEDRAHIKSLRRSRAEMLSRCFLAEMSSIGLSPEEAMNCLQELKGDQ